MFLFSIKMNLSDDTDMMYVFCMNTDVVDVEYIPVCYVFLYQLKIYFILLTFLLLCWFFYVYSQLPISLNIQFFA